MENFASINKKLIPITHPEIQFAGRIDFSKPEEPIFVYSGSWAKLHFTGTSIGVVLNNHNNWGCVKVGFLLDGKEGVIELKEKDTESYLEIAKDLRNKEHELIFFKRQDFTHYFNLLGFVIDENAEVVKNAPYPKRRMECFGDSVSAGAVCEAVDYVGKVDPEGNNGQYDNSWRSYISITSRNLGAVLNNNAQGGIAIFNGTGWFYAPEYIGVESTYDKLFYVPPMTPWDFSKFIPHVVVFAIGQNDNHVEGKPDLDIFEPEYRHRWKEKYKEIIRDLRSHYPKATFVLITTVLMHDPERDVAIEEIKNELNDAKIHHFMFKRNGAATPGHPRIQEQYEMAEELTAFISGLGDEIWED